MHQPIWQNALQGLQTAIIVRMGISLVRPLWQLDVEGTQGTHRRFNLAKMLDHIGFLLLLYYCPA